MRITKISTALCIFAFSSGISHAAESDEAMKEYDQAITLKPDLENGRKAFESCAVCHGPEGWGNEEGTYPQIAGQLASVTIKQLADIRAGNRSNPMMTPFSSMRALGGPQAMADVAAYIAQLPMTPHNGIGPGMDLASGERLYKENCVDCHGENGEGDVKKHIPLIQGQHFNYLERQFRWISDGKRRNADEEMVKQIKSFWGHDITDVMDYTSRLQPPKEKLAEAGWQNPDFPNYVRTPAYGSSTRGDNRETSDRKNRWRQPQD